VSTEFGGIKATIFAILKSYRYYFVHTLEFKGTKAQADRATQHRLFLSLSVLFGEEEGLRDDTQRL
jgi:hypothetical protein